METLDAENSAKQEYILRKLIVQHADEYAGNHQWIWEKDRWKELVFGIVSRAAECPEDHARVVTNQLEALDLIGIGSLAGLTEKNSGSEVLRQRIGEILQENDFSTMKSAAIVEALAEVARYFMTKHQGKVQKLFRKFGEALLNELQTEIAFSTLAPADVEYILVYWLQNVLTLPLSLKDDHVIQFAAENRIEVSKLIEAADGIGVNIAFLDDLIRHRCMRAAAAREDSDGTL